jgi:hypothetical protein
MIGEKHLEMLKFENTEKMESTLIRIYSKIIMGCAGESILFYMVDYFACLVFSFFHVCYFLFFNCKAGEFVELEMCKVGE